VVSVGAERVASWDAMRKELAGAPAGPVSLGLEGRPAVTLNLPAPGPSRDTLLSALRPLAEPVLAVVIPDQAAARGGLRPGDRIVAIDGQPLATWTDVVERIRAAPGKPLRMDVQREGQRLALTVTPKAERERGELVGKIGASEQPQVHYRRLGFGQVLAEGWHQTVYMVQLLLTTLRDLFTGALSPRNLGGLLAIGEASGQSAEQGPLTYLSFLAFLSVNLAVLNLLPIPILDGGHLMFLLIEAVRGRPLSLEARIRMSHVGLIIVVGLMLWANGNDVVRLVERYFGK
jgi:regulator of sigma E protease